MSTRVMGIDPGLSITGYGVLEADAGRVKLIEAGAIRSNRRDPLAARLDSLFHELLTALDELQPDVLVVEELFAAYGHPHTAIQMAHARGVILLSAEQRVIPVVGYPATEVKRALTGNGRASKSQVQRTITQRLRLHQLPEPADVSDALALALCHALRLKSERTTGRKQE